jgi:Papain-like cysteine protease AvrRpt2
MKLKILILGFLIMLMFKSIYCIILPVPANQQELDQVCWAACSQSILQYYNIPISQYEIAVYGTEGVNTWNWLYGQSVNPTRRGINMILTNFADIESEGFDRNLTMMEIQDEIQGLRPFVIRWEWNFGGGHFIVGMGIEENTLYTMDPWYGEYVISDYDWFVYSNNHTWTHSLYLVDIPETNTESILKSNYPNPFNPETTIEFFIQNDSRIELSVFNIKGQKIKTLIQNEYSNGTYSIVWNGDDELGRIVSSGIYYYKLKVNGKTEAVKKCLLLK